ncbi:MAG: hypothetical protein H8E46_06710 [FCB group bacterium]|nr:hypothetical protein [FCB group bacterium]
MRTYGRCGESIQSLEISIPNDCSVRLSSRNIVVPPKLKIRQQFRNTPTADAKSNKIRFVNPDSKKCCLVLVDDCVFGKEEQKCDYLLLVPINKENNSNYDEYYIELKTKRGVKKAIEQLLNTITLLGRKNNSTIREAYVVCRKVDKTAKTYIQRFRPIFSDSFNCFLDVVENPEPKII